MTHLGYLIAGWAFGIGVLAIYAALVLRRGRKLSEVVPSDRQRWISSTEDQARIKDE